MKVITFNCERTSTASHPLNTSNVFKHLTGHDYTNLGTFSGWTCMMDNLSIITIKKANKKHSLKSNKIEKNQSFKIKKQAFKNKYLLVFFKAKFTNF